MLFTFYCWIASDQWGSLGLLRCGSVCHCSWCCGCCSCCCSTWSTSTHTDTVRVYANAKRLFVFGSIRFSPAVRPRIALLLLLPHLPISLFPSSSLPLSLSLHAVLLSPRFAVMPWSPQLNLRIVLMPFYVTSRLRCRRRCQLATAQSVAVTQFQVKQFKIKQIL